MSGSVEQNVIGPVLRKLRYERGLTQAMFCARCSRVGWDVGENTIAKIEARYRCVTDREIIALAKALRVPVQDLFPK
jgi:transcriptional regulator with XRE-family HTH domain